MQERNKIMNLKNLSRKKGLIACTTIFIAIVVDQIIKVWVKTTMPLGGQIHIADWFYIKFIENNGMAYGMTFINKPVLSLFRMVLIALLGWYIVKQVKSKARTFYVLVLSLVFAGAVGNLIDCMFYGLVFSGSSPFYVSYFVPFGDGYSTFLTGRVVDMFYFPLIVTTWPGWVPVWGGEEFVFFSPIFNFADACISVGFVLLILFCRTELSQLSFEGKRKHDNFSAKERKVHDGDISDVSEKLADK